MSNEEARVRWRPGRTQCSPWLPLTQAPGGEVLRSLGSDLHLLHGNGQQLLPGCLCRAPRGRCRASCAASREEGGGGGCLRWRRENEYLYFPIHTLEILNYLFSADLQCRREGLSPTAP